MKNFFSKIGHSFYSYRFYDEARDVSISNGLKFLFGFILFLSVVFGVVAFSSYIYMAPKIEDKVLQYVETEYPDDLLVTIKDKTLLTNKTEPVLFAAQNMQSNQTVARQNVLVLAPNELISDIALLSKYDTYMIVTAKSIVAQNADSEFRTYMLDYPNIDITKGKVNEFIAKVFKTIMPMVFIFSIPAILIILSFVVLKNLLVLFIVSLIIFLIFKLQKIDLSYKDIYRMGVYSIVPVLIVSIVLFPFYLGGNLVDMLVMAAIILYVNKDRQFSSVTTETEVPKEPIDSNPAI